MAYYNSVSYTQIESQRLVDDAPVYYSVSTNSAYYAVPISKPYDAGAP